MGVNAFLRVGIRFAMWAFMKILCAVWVLILAAMFSQGYLLDETTVASAVLGPIFFAGCLALMSGLILQQSEKSASDRHSVALTQPRGNGKPTFQPTSQIDLLRAS